MYIYTYIHIYIYVYIYTNLPIYKEAETARVLEICLCTRTHERQKPATIHTRTVPIAQAKQDCVESGAAVFEHKAALVQISATKGRPTMAMPSPCPAGSDAPKQGTRAGRREHKPKQNTDSRTKTSAEGEEDYQKTLPPSVAAAK